MFRDMPLSARAAGSDRASPSAEVGTWWVVLTYSPGQVLRGGGEERN